VANFQDDDVIVYEPGDFQGASAQVCVSGFGSGDADDDGFTDADEQANGSNPCSAGDVPADVDNDFISDLKDPDDDNDGISDVDDPFALDYANGANTPLGVDYQWENGSVGAGFIGDLGFSGLMTNGVDDYQSLYDLNEMTIIGAAGVVTIDAVPSGDAVRGKNSQQYGFQFGVDVSPASDVFRVHTRVLKPFNGITPSDYQSMGVYIGNGDQDNYTKLTIVPDGLQYLSEVGGSIQHQNKVGEFFLDADHIDLIIEIDPASALATGYYTVTHDGVTSAEQQVGSYVFPSDWLTGPTSLAVGVIATSLGADKFPATWDFLTVKELSGQSSNTAPVVTVIGPDVMAVGDHGLLDATVDDDGLPGGSLSTHWSVESASGDVVFADQHAARTAVSFASAGSYILKLTVTDGELTASENLSVNVVNLPSGNSSQHYRLNVGGPDIASTGGAWLSDFEFVNTGKTWSSASPINMSGVSDVPSALFNTERYDRAGGAEIEWKLPVTPGQYQVRLYFAEIYFGAMSEGARVFDAEVEGQKIENIDVYSAVGGNTAYMRSVTVDADSTLNISLSRKSQNPALKAIEVIAANGGSVLPANDAPMVFAGEDVIADVGDVVSLNAMATDDGQPQGQLSYIWQQLSGPAQVEFSSATDLESSVQFDAVGSYQLRFSADDGELVSSDDLTVTVSAVQLNTAPVASAGANQQTQMSSPFSLSGSVADDGLPNGPVSVEWALMSGPSGVVFTDKDALVSGVSFSVAGEYVFRLTANDGELSHFDDVVVVVENSQTSNDLSNYRINVGGGAVQDAAGVWAADDGQYVSGGNIYTTSKSIDTSMTPNIPEKIFQSERWANGSMEWSFPVTPGTYQVNLYFSEIFKKTMSVGARVFDVNVEGEVEAGVDIYKFAAGGKVGVVLSFGVDSDDFLDIELTAIAQNPAIKGIEIIAVEESAFLINEELPVAGAVPDQLVGGVEAFGLAGTPATAAEYGDSKVQLFQSGDNGSQAGVMEGAKSNVGATFAVVRSAEELLDTTRTWVEVNPKTAPLSRVESGAVTVDGKLYALGGMTHTSRIPVEQVQMYDPAINDWSYVTNLPEPVNHFQPVAYDGKIYIIGTLEGDGFPKESGVSKIHIYDTRSNVWSQGGIPENRIRGAAGTALHNNKIYVVGGTTMGHAGGYVNWFDEYDPVTGAWRVLPPMPVARDHITVAVSGDRLVVAGGRQTGKVGHQRK
jgi:hypothetical protein